MVLGKDLIRTTPQADGFRSLHINIAVLSTLGGSHLISENRKRQLQRSRLGTATMRRNVLNQPRTAPRLQSQGLHSPGHHSAHKQLQGGGDENQPVQKGRNKKFPMKRCNVLKSVQDRFPSIQH